MDLVMKEYLSETLSKLRSNNYTELNIVLGNESCDLDSAVSSLVYASFLCWQYTQLNCKVCTTNKKDDNTSKDNIFVPMLNVCRADYNLKTEVVFAFKEHGVKANDLLFRDDIEIEKLVTSSKTNVILVDHHILSIKDQFLIPYVTEIIDHRPIDKAQWRYKDDTRSTIEIVGSCSTLVAQRILDLSAMISKSNQYFKDNPVSCALLLCTIILDTVNFSKEVNKATPHDEKIVKFLEETLQTKNTKEERCRMLERYLKARTDVSSLSPAQLLKKDTKIIGDIYVPSLPILVKKPESLNAVTSALTRSSCSTALLLGMCLVDGLKRDAAVFSPEESRADALAAHLQKWSKPPLHLTPEEVLPGRGCHYYQQLNLTASRKQYIPAVREFQGLSEA